MQAKVVELSGYVDCVAFVLSAYRDCPILAEPADVDEPSSGVDCVVLCFNLDRPPGVNGKLCVLIILTDLAVMAGLG